MLSKRLMSSMSSFSLMQGSKMPALQDLFPSETSMIRIHPILHYFLAYALVSASLAFVPPRAWMRLCAVAVCQACIIFSLLHMDRSRWSGSYLMLTGHWTCAAILHSNYVLFLTRATPPPGSSATERLKWAYELLLNPRGIGTSWQNQNIPPFSRKDPRYVPSRFSLITKRIAKALAAFTIFKVFTMANEIYVTTIRYGDYGEDKESIIRRLGSGEVSMHELYIRIWLPVEFLLWAYCMFEIMHDVISAVAVALGGEPGKWPPLLGDMREAYSLRRFWSLYWHSLIRAAFLANAAFLAQTILRIPRSSPIYRQLITLIIFTFTAVVHAVGHWVMAPACDVTPVLRWYLLMGLGITFEDLVGRLFSGMAVGRWRRLFGYIWVWMYLAWSLPKMVFPEEDCEFEYDY